MTVNSEEERPRLNTESTETGAQGAQRNEKWPGREKSPDPSRTQGELKPACRRQVCATKKKKPRTGQGALLYKEKCTRTLIASSRKKISKAKEGRAKARPYSRPRSGGHSMLCPYKEDTEASRDASGTKWRRKVAATRKRKKRREIPHVRRPTRSQERNAEEEVGLLRSE